jgi:hypothetical protein
LLRPTFYFMNPNTQSMKSRKVLLCVLAVAAINARSQVVATKQWVNTVGVDYSISNISTALAANSNVHVAGRTNVTPGNADIIVQCTDSSSAVLWTYTYDNGGYDTPEAICVDAAGNTYIAGVSYDAATGLDYICIKLDNTGTPVWSFPMRFDAAMGATDEAYDLCVDSNGDIYVTGKSFSGLYYRTVTLKLDGASGAIIWQNDKGGITGDSEGRTIVLANNDQDVIIGTSTHQGGDPNIVVYQIPAATGVAAGWQRPINGTAPSSNDQITKLINVGNHIALSGMLENMGTDKDYVVARINPVNGSIIWSREYDYSSDDKATCLVADSAGNIAVTGYVYDNTTSVYQYHTVLYDTSGTRMWVHPKNINCPTLNVEPSITCDTIAHHFYVSGETERTSRDILVYQITPSGSDGWYLPYDATGNTDAATRLVVNGIGVVFVSANTEQSLGIYQISTIKIVQTPVYFPPDLGTQEINDKHFVFQQNIGQLLHPNGSPVSSEEVSFYNQGCSPSYYFNKEKISHIVFDRDSIQDTIVRVDMKFLGANSLAEIFPYEPVEAKKHYFTTSAQGITNVSSYQRLFIPEIYPNVDVHHYSNTSGLKSYFVFKVPGESMAGVRLQVEGANSTAIDLDGNLIASTDLGDVNMGTLVAYQASYNPLNPTVPVLTPLTASWLNIGSDLYRFNVSGYAPFWPIVVYVSKQGVTSAPAAAPNGNLWWATFIGNQGDEQIITNKVDAKDNLYIAGYTTAGNYPTTFGTYNSGPGSPSSIRYGIFTRFDKDGKMEYSTYYGNSGTACSSPYTQVKDIAIDSLYNMYIVGGTNSNNMAIKVKTGAINYSSNTANSGGNCQTAFIAKFNPKGDELHFSSYYGGTGPDMFECVRYSNGHIYMAGRSISPSIPLGSPQPNTTQYSTGEGMYMRLDTAGVIKHNTKIFRPVVAGDADKNGNYYMLLSIAPPGSTGPFMPTITPAPGFYASGFNGNWDWGLQRMTANDSLNWSTHIGGSGTDNPVGISIRDSVMALCGTGSSTDFPFLVAPGDSGDVAFGGGTGFDIQMMKFNLKNGQILWSAYHGTNRNETAQGISLDRNYNLFVTGDVSGSSALSTKMVPVWGYYNQNSYIGRDGIILGYSQDNKKTWATFYGSLSSSASGGNLFDDIPTRVTVNNNGKLFISGITNAKHNTLPLVQWNSVCYYDNAVADLFPSTSNDGFVAMFETSGLFPVGIRENTSAKVLNGLTLFPNPNNGIFNIRFTGNTYEMVNVSVYNIVGQRVFEESRMKPEGNELKLHLGELSKGIYLINLNDGKRSNTLKFVVE